MNHQVETTDLKRGSCPSTVTHWTAGILCSPKQRRESLHVQPGHQHHRMPAWAMKNPLCRYTFQYRHGVMWKPFMACC